MRDRQVAPLVIDRSIGLGPKLDRFGARRASCWLARAKVDLVLNGGSIERMRHRLTKLRVAEERSDFRIGVVVIERVERPRSRSAVPEAKLQAALRAGHFERGDVGQSD